MKFRLEQTMVRESQRQNLWKLAEERQLAEVEQLAANQHRTEWHRTRHDSKNWVGTAKRLLQSNHPEQAARCLNAVGTWLDAAPQRETQPLHQRLLDMLPGWQAMRAKHVALCVRVSPSLSQYSPNNDLLISLMDNLIRNALWATIHGAVRAQLWQGPNRLGICVADTGPGLGALQTSGWGMALSILKQQVQAQQGTWQTDARAGVCQRIWLPTQLR